MVKNKLFAPKKKDETKAPKCVYDVEREGRILKLVARCKGCAGKANLSDPPCIEGILDALGKELHVKTVILSDYLEREYVETSVDLLRKMNQQLDELKNIGLRSPITEHFKDELKGSDRKMREKTCSECNLNPQRLFTSMQRNFITNLEDFHNLMVKAASYIITSPHLMADMCPECKRKTIEDFDYIYGIFEEFSKFIRFEAYKVVS